MVREKTHYRASRIVGFTIGENAKVVFKEQHCGERMYMYIQVAE